MPRFYFDIQDSAGSHRDEDGSEFLDQSQTRAMALNVLAAIAQDVQSESDQRHFACDVRDETGRVIYTATLFEVGRWIN
jgi:hypothetical protein